VTKTPTKKHAITIATIATTSERRLPKPDLSLIIDLTFSPHLASRQLIAGKEGDSLLID
jgi:hypothetical protein